MLLRDSSTLAHWCLDVCFQEEKELMMTNWLEDLTHMVSDDTLPRREALRRMVGVVAGATLAAWLPEQALAKNIPWKKQCTFGGNCDSGFPNCNAHGMRNEIVPVASKDKHVSF